ncbi:hemolysin family protein [Asaia bogorensis]|uniref:Hemolysin C n=1 Tax=Asaia bogorensis NBRC 16594 TaxID=1231624 RepID=A0AAN4U1M5_9PROT|nr:hemolysin family protein [Asaia bogorensis]BAT19920.1 hemolysin/magnesium/cobalt transporter CorC/HlyC [Asaia bogorensis NBRC 16594]GBQ81097.1 hemolysin/magnesium/cobalt transporter CorC/HlyC [Asaia bogorensis NBRC 16594]GEL52664.1 hemolysin C [Asaia bogorensis NBRC 16594]
MSESDDHRQRPAKGLFGIFNRKGREQGLRLSIAALVEEAAAPHPEAGTRPELDRQERALITNVLHLREKTADDVMVPRADIVSMSADITLDEALDFMRRENHSRVPVYREHLDNVIGMIHVKDLIAYIGTSEAFDIEPLLRQPLLVAPQIPVLDLLLQMRQRRTHLALVIDEYGGVDGLVTIEDLVETIVGDISDEHDEPVSAMISERADGSFDLDARLPVDELEGFMGPVLTEAEREAEIETVGGLVFRLAGHVPIRGEVFTHESGLVFRVTDADARHIRALRMRVPPDWVRSDNPTPHHSDEKR